MKVYSPSLRTGPQTFLKKNAQKRRGILDRKAACGTIHFCRAVQQIAHLTGVMKSLGFVHEGRCFLRGAGLASKASSQHGDLIFDNRVGPRVGCPVYRILNRLFPGREWTVTVVLRTSAFEERFNPNEDNVLHN